MTSSASTESNMVANPKLGGKRFKAYSSTIKDLGETAKKSLKKLQKVSSSITNLNEWYTGVVKFVDMLSASHLMDKEMTIRVPEEEAKKVSLNNAFERELYYCERAGAAREEAQEEEQKYQFRKMSNSSIESVEEFERVLSPSLKEGLTPQMKLRMRRMRKNMRKEEKQHDPSPPKVTPSGQEDFRELLKENQRRLAAQRKKTKVEVDEVEKERVFFANPMTSVSVGGRHRNIRANIPITVEKEKRFYELESEDSRGVRLYVYA
jgi:hypothetical protein